MDNNKIMNSKINSNKNHKNNKIVRAKKEDRIFNNSNKF